MPPAVLEPELSQVMAVFFNEVIETLLPPAIFLSLLSPVIHLALHGPSLNPPDQDLRLVLVPALFLTVLPSPVSSNIMVQLRVLPGIGTKHFVTPRSRAAGHNVIKILSPQFLPSSCVSQLQVPGVWVMPGYPVQC